MTLLIFAPVFLVAAVSPPDASPGWRLLQSSLSGVAGLVAAGALTFGVLESLRGNPAPLGMLLRTGFAKLGRVFKVSFFASLFIAIGLVLLVVPGVVAMCALYVAMPAAVVEQDLASVDALDRSRSLTKGSRWGIFVVLLVVLAVTMAITGPARFVFAAGAAYLPHPLPVLLETAVDALVTPLGACASAVAYHDLRIAKEGVSTAELVKVFE